MTEPYDRKIAENALRASEERYRLVVERMREGLTQADNDGTVELVNERLCEIVGYTREELLGRTMDVLAAFPEDLEMIHASRERCLRGVSDQCEIRVRRKDGRIIWVEIGGAPVTDANGNVIGSIGVYDDISVRKKTEEQIEYQAYHDALTDLPNRLLFRDRLTVALARARRDGHRLAVMFLDLDHFKSVNDTLGHSFGDELLKIVADRLKRSLREADSIARIGGDEFTILLPEIREDDDAAVVAGKLLDVISQPLQIDEQELFVTTSIGIAVFPTDGDTAESLLRSADGAMYRVKDAGRNAYQLCTPAMNSRAAERLGLESALRRAVDRGELVLHYQPQIELSSGRIAGMEALLRWNHPSRGLLHPERFIAIAEETRMILPIGEWVVRQAWAQAQAWRTSRFPGLRIGVNLSPRQFQQAGLRRLIAATLSAGGPAASNLEIEITESAALQNTERTVAALQELREMGARIAIDDFGAGHLSLNDLRAFPIDVLKIDQTFVRGIEASRSDRAIIAAIIAIARGLDLNVTAVGVETEEQLRFLREAGCDEVQGFLLGRPAPAEEI